MRFIPVPIHWMRHPACKRLRRADPEHVGRWFYLITVAASANAGGDVVLDCGTALTADDLADEYDHDYEGWRAFVTLCHELDLLRTDSGTLTVVPWRDWHRAPSDMPETSRHRKAAERERRKSEELASELAEARAQLEMLAESRKFFSASVDGDQVEDACEPELEDVSESLDAETEAALPRPRLALVHSSESLSEAAVPSCPELSRAVPSGPEIRSRSDLDLDLDRESESDLNANDRRSRKDAVSVRGQTRAGPPTGARAAPDSRQASDADTLEKLKSSDADGSRWTEHEFRDRLQALYTSATGKPWTRADGEFFRTKMAEKAWHQGLDRAQVYIALRFAAEEFLRRQADGKTVKSPWGYILHVAGSYADHAAAEVERARSEPGYRPRFVRSYELFKTG